MSLEFVAELGDRGLDVALHVPNGQTLALIGPNGAGKSTVLELLAGILRPDRGHAAVAGTTLFRVGAPPEVWLPPHRRGVGLLAQDARLFPHLTASANVAFGPRSAGRGRRAAAKVAAQWLARVDATGLADRRPDDLSGGQAQRVALARALAAEPALLLLDEPLAAIDAPAAAELRDVLRRVLTDRTTILVTHEPLDAALIADRMAVLDGGTVVEEGTVADVLGNPRSAFAADLLGVNLIPGTAGPAHTVILPSGQLIAGRPGPQGAVPDGQPALARFAPSAVVVHLTQQVGSARNTIPGTITGIEPLGGLMRLRVDAVRADVTPAAVAELGLTVGSRVLLSIKAAEVTVVRGSGD